MIKVNNFNSDVTAKTWKYLSSPHDIETLKGAVSQDDLCGVDEIIAKCENSPRHRTTSKTLTDTGSPKHQHHQQQQQQLQGSSSRIPRLNHSSPQQSRKSKIPTPGSTVGSTAGKNVKNLNKSKLTTNNPGQIKVKSTKQQQQQQQIPVSSIGVKTVPQTTSSKIKKVVNKTKIVPPGVNTNNSKIAPPGGNTNSKAVPPGVNTNSKITPPGVNTNNSKIRPPGVNTNSKTAPPAGNTNSKIAPPCGNTSKSIASVSDKQSIKTLKTQVRINSRIPTTSFTSKRMANINQQQLPSSTITTQNGASKTEPSEINENGLEPGGSGEDEQDGLEPVNREERGFETFLMTGDMIIRKSAPASQKHSPTPDTSPKHSPPADITNTSPKTSPLADTHKTRLSSLNGAHDTELPSIPKDYSSPAKHRVINSPTSESPISPASDRSHHTDNNENIKEEKIEINRNDDGIHESKIVTIVASKSAEKVSQHGGHMTQHGGHMTQSSMVRTSKSHENYLENPDQLTLVDIDFDDKMASSVDALLTEKSTSSLNELKPNVANHVTASRSLQSSPERKLGGAASVPGFISLEQSTCCSINSNNHKGALDIDENGSPVDCDPPSVVSAEPRRVTDPTLGGSTDSEKSPEDGFQADFDLFDPNNMFHQPLKEVDRPSASRLAKRLYNLEGFKKTDVSRHLSKKNDFAQLVGEEYLKYFEFVGETLDGALRIFLDKFALTGETQERERILAHFSKRYVECNQKIFHSEDACHTLTCAIMLLNTDLHGQNIGRKMTCSEFVENLAELNDGDNFPREVLKAIYNAIKTEQLLWSAYESDEECDDESTLTNSIQPENIKMSSSANPFLDIPDPNSTTEYIKGWVMRKCTKDPDGRKTPFGKRGWKMFHATLKDMILYLHKDEHGFKKSIVYQMSHAVRIHHCLAIKATDYRKKQHVFSLKTADWSEYLFQTSDSKELQRWIDTINFVAAALSAPPLPGGCGSQRKFQRPLLPSSYTKLSLPEQLTHHEQKVIEIENDLKEHQLYPPSKSDKQRIIEDYEEREKFLEYELKRFKMYSYLLQAKMTSYPTEMEPSLVETAIHEEPSSPDTPPGGIKPDKSTKPVQRSLSDRVSRSCEDVELDFSGSGFVVKRHPPNSPEIRPRVNSLSYETSL
ncbi:uncharacterized protein LOC141903581 isoform X2 [Tubulanus polymorphus]|uniref:uncharacterized protein LOC141903581 isoform X2 n=1 Tax=Tubulanus polymorphus TaxID=672921 RepID=UPI003DA47F97